MYMLTGLPDKLETATALPSMNGTEQKWCLSKTCTGAMFAYAGLEGSILLGDEIGVLCVRFRALGAAYQEGFVVV